MFVILTNRVDQKQATAAENKLFCLKKQIPRNISPDLPLAWNIISQVSEVQPQYELEKITRIIVILKKETKKTFQSSDLLNSTKTMTRAEKNRQIRQILAAFIDIHKGHVWGD